MKVIFLENLFSRIMEAFVNLILLLLDLVATKFALVYTSVKMLVLNISTITIKTRTKLNSVKST